jgi:hypothetical protein
VKQLPTKLKTGDRVRLIGTQFQQWGGRLQLTGKNIQFGDSLISISLSDAVIAWDVVREAGAQLYFPKLATCAVVLIWGKTKATACAQTKLLCTIDAKNKLIRSCFQVEIYMFRPSFSAG